MNDSTIIKKKISPQRILVIGFIVVILIGTFLLLLPAMTAEQNSISFIDAFFTATSSVCVTGLVVKDTGSFFSFWGKLVILSLIQIGAVGYMTIASFLFLLIGKKISMRDRLAIQQSLAQKDIGSIFQFSKYVIITTFFIECIGAIILTFAFLRRFSFKESIFLGIFHSISAFCNAGFSLFSTSLEGFKEQPLIVLTMASLFILGGVGFIAISNIYYSLIKKTKRITIHTKMVVLVTTILIIIGFLFFFVFEFKNPNTIGNLPLGQKILISFFQAVTPRTAGFNVISVNGMLNVTLFFTLFLMFIGASPGGTGGGIKTTTFGVAISTIFAVIRGKKDVTFSFHRIAEDIIKKSHVVIILGAAIIGIMTGLLLFFEKISVIKILFEVVSAFGTVGLSTGITSTLLPISKLFLILTMFIGRLGPLTVGIAVLKEMEIRRFRYPEQRIMVG